MAAGDVRRRSILAELGTRVLHRGYVVIIGVVGGCIGAVNEFFDGPVRLMPWASIAIVAVSLVVAFLWAVIDLVSDKNKTIASLKTKSSGTVDPRYDGLSDLLGRSLTVGVELSQAREWPPLEGWEDHTRALIAAAYGDGEAARIFTPELRAPKVHSGEPMRRRLTSMLDLPPPKAEIINATKELLGRMATLTIRAEFDPARWSPFDPVVFREGNARPVKKGMAQDSWACPWCSCEHQDWSRHCNRCRAERAGDFVYFTASTGIHREVNAALPPSPLEEWLERKILAAELLERQRGTRTDEWFFTAMGQWDFENVQEMHEGDSPIAPDLVDAYREDPRSGQTDGLKTIPKGDRRVIEEGELDRYYSQRLAWLRATLSRLSSTES